MRPAGRADQCPQLGVERTKRRCRLWAVPGQFCCDAHNVTFLLPRCGRVRSSDRGEPMRRREFISLLSAAAAWPLAARAQQTPARPLIGMLVPLSVAAATGNIAAFRSALRDVGYVEGRNATLELRYGDGSLERLAPLVDELLALKPDVLFVGGKAAAIAAHNATQLIPIVIITPEDPIPS